MLTTNNKRVKEIEMVASQIESVLARIMSKNHSGQELRLLHRESCGLFLKMNQLVSGIDLRCTKCGEVHNIKKWAMVHGDGILNVQIIRCPQIACGTPHSIQEETPLADILNYAYPPLSQFFYQNR